MTDNCIVTRISQHKLLKILVYYICMDQNDFHEIFTSAELVSKTQAD